MGSVLPTYTKQPSYEVNPTDDPIPIEEENENMIIKDKFKLYVAMDFGTNGFGLAYGISPELKLDDNKDNDTNNEDNVITHKWQKKLYHDYLKKKAQILVDENGKIYAFGENASVIKQSFDDDDEKSRYKLIENVKMKLYDDPRWINPNGIITKHDDVKEVDLKTTIKSNDGYEFDTETIFVGILKKLKKESKAFISSFNFDDDIDDDDIQWILTIPAIWSDNAKQQMREWGIKAGLINQNIANQLRMVLEPECAALHVQYLINNNKTDELIILHSKRSKNQHSKSQQQKPNTNSQQLKPNTNNQQQKANNINIELKTGDKYILIDAGGGTVDIVTHEVIHNFGVKEVLPAEGGACGSTKIDTQIVLMLYELFGEKAVQKFAAEQEAIYQTLMENCHWSKTQFADNPTQKYHGIEVPMTFVNYVKKYFDRNIETTIEQKKQLMDVVVYNEQIVQFPSADFIRIHVDVWKKMFNQCIERILVYCDDLLYDDKMKNGQCKFLFMVGGLSQSIYFQQKMIEWIGDSGNGISIVTPKCSILSIVKGAARFGIIPNFIQARKLTKNYAILVAVDPKEAESKYKVSKEYINAHTKKKYGHKIVKVLNCFAKRGDEIDLDFKYQRKYKRLTTKQNSAQINIYCNGNDECPNTKEEASKLGSFILYFDKNQKDLEITVEYKFNDTILSVYAYPTSQPDKIKQKPIIHTDPFRKSLSY